MTRFVNVLLIVVLSVVVVKCSTTDQSNQVCMNNFCLTASRESCSETLFSLSNGVIDVSTSLDLSTLRTGEEKRIGCLTSTINQRCRNCVVLTSWEVTDVEMSACFHVELVCPGVAAHRIEFGCLNAGSCIDSGSVSLPYLASEISDFVNSLNSEASVPDGIESTSNIGSASLPEVITWDSAVSAGSVAVPDALESNSEIGSASLPDTFFSWSVSGGSASVPDALQTLDSQVGSASLPDPELSWSVVDTRSGGSASVPNALQSYDSDVGSASLPGPSFSWSPFDFGSGGSASVPDALQSFDSNVGSASLPESSFSWSTIDAGSVSVPDALESLDSHVGSAPLPDQMTDETDNSLASVPSAVSESSSHASGSLGDHSNYPSGGSASVPVSDDSSNEGGSASLPYDSNDQSAEHHHDDDDNNDNDDDNGGESSSSSIKYPVAPPSPRPPSPHPHPHPPRPDPDRKEESFWDAVDSHLTLVIFGSVALLAVIFAIISGVGFVVCRSAMRPRYVNANISSAVDDDEDNSNFFDL